MTLSETRCKWTEAGYVQPDGEPCDVPRREHCTARKTCSQHLGWGEQTCARCLGRTRMDIRQIVQRAALMLPEAMVVGVNSEAASMAGPTTDPEAWSWRKVTAKRGGPWHVSLPCELDHVHRRCHAEDDDETDPQRVLTTWAQMLSEDYKLDRPDVWTLANAAAFLERILHRVAQDEEQDFPLMAREIKRCRTHLESVLRDSQQPERGAFCPTCKKATPPALVRLVREYPHYCEDEDCCQIHVTTDELDVWVCPANPLHWWTPAGYGNLMDERKVAG